MPYWDTRKHNQGEREREREREYITKEKESSSPVLEVTEKLNDEEILKGNHPNPNRKLLVVVTLRIIQLVMLTRVPLKKVA